MNRAKTSGNWLDGPGRRLVEAAPTRALTLTMATDSGSDTTTSVSVVSSHR